MVRSFGRESDWDAVEPNVPTGDLLNIRFGEKLLLGPAAAEGFDEADAGDLALAGKLGIRAFGLESFATCVHDFEIADETGAVTFGGQIGSPLRITNGPLLRLRLLAQMPNAGKAVLDITEGDKDALTILRHGFCKSSLRMLVIRAVSATGENRE